MKVAIFAQYDFGLGFVPAAVEAAGVDNVLYLSDRRRRHPGIASEVEQACVATLETGGFNDPATAEGLRAAGVDLVLIYGCREVIEAGALSQLPAVMNFHCALLPLHRGPSPLFWTVLAGEDRCGLSVCRISSKIDKGLLLYQESAAVPAGATQRTLMDVTMPIAQRLCRRIIGDFAAGRLPAGRDLDPYPAPYETRPPAPIRTVLPSASVAAAERVIRACWPFYDAIVPSARFTGRLAPVPPGEPVSIPCADGILVAYRRTP